MKANRIRIVILLVTQRLCWFTEDLFSLLDRDEPVPFCADLKAGAHFGVPVPQRYVGVIKLIARVGA
jgi:hypothetical protein